MLSSLDIKNIGPIQNASLEFSSGLNVITGETGAGKSMLLTAISLMLGNSNSKLSTIKDSSDEFYVHATFDDLSFSMIEFVSNCGIDISDELIVSRQMKGDKMRSYVCNQRVSLNILNSIAEKIVYIHGQSQYLNLLKPSEVCEIVDEYGNLHNLKNEYMSVKKHLHDINAEIDKVVNLQSSKDLQIALLNAFKEEFEKVNPQKDEIADLKSSIKMQESYEEYSHLLNNASDTISSSSSNDFSLLSSLSSVRLIIQKLSKFNKDFEGYYDKVDDIYEVLEDLNLKISRQIADFSTQNTDVDSLQSRLFVLTDFEKKHHDSLNNLIERYNKTSDELASLENHDTIYKDLQKKQSDLTDELSKISRNLHQARNKSAKDLSKLINNQLVDLNMKDSSVKISFDLVDVPKFDYSPHKNVNFMPISKIASGGELSRICLAIEVAKSQKTAYDISIPSQKNAIKTTYIFDEVDTGIGGVTALNVAQKLSDISKDHQIIVVTHLAQVAAKADRHFKISKDSNNETSLTKIEGDLRVDEIARMMSGKITSSSLQHAKELLESS